jgi:glutathione peroxidase-family protein
LHFEEIAPIRKRSLGKPHAVQWYGATFAKIDVNGPNAHPLYRYLKSGKSGILGTEAIKWNFTKFLVGPAGQSR